MSAPVFSARGIEKRFGNQRALDGIDIDLHEGEILGIAGANGAGKSTLMRVLAGAIQPDKGALMLEGRPLRMQSMEEAWREGIAFVSQELNLFPALSVAENLLLVPGRTGAFMAADRLTAAERMLNRLGLSAPLSARVGSLSLAERQLVEIARALLQAPRMLILDEPTSSLLAAETERLHGILRDVKSAGTAVIYISHFIEEMIDICDRIVVLRDGREVLLDQSGGKPAVSKVVVAMLGGQKSAAHRSQPASPVSIGVPGLSIHALRGPVILDLPQFEARPGEVIGLAGLAGSGIEELFAILFGRLPLKKGRISLPSGSKFRSGSAAAVANGVAYFPADRKRLGLALDQSIRENVSSVRALTLGRDGFVLRPKREARLAEARCKSIGVKMASVEQPAASLSGGNQQKVVFAKWVEATPSLLLLDDPMRGVDIGAKDELTAVIRRLAADGRVVLLYSSDPSDYVAVADRVSVFVNGRVTGELAGSSMTEHGIVNAINASDLAQDSLKT